MLRSFQGKRPPMKSLLPILFALCAAIMLHSDDLRAQNFPENSVTAYRQFLSTLDQGSIRSISTAHEELKKRFSSAPDNTAVAAFRVFKEFHAGVVNSISRKLFWRTSAGTQRKDFQAALNEIMSGSPGYINQLTPELLNGDPIRALDARGEEFRKGMEEKYGAALKELREFRKNGMRFYWGEGDWYGGVDNDYLTETASFLKGDYGDYLRFQAREGKERVAEDAALMISWDELRERIIRYETFMKTHPELPETEMEVRRMLNLLIAYYLTGIENTRAYDLYGEQGTGALVPELRTSYERFLSENTESVFHPIVQDVYEIGKQHDFKFNGKLRSYLDSKGYGFFLEMYPKGK
jgi:hypothetical protein